MRTGDSIPPILEVLRKVDPTFCEIPSLSDGQVSTQFVSRDNFKVEFFHAEPVVGRPGRQASPDASVGWGGGISAALLRFLIYQPIRAVLLHGAGVPVLIPSPERYAIHKLIVGSRRKDDRDATATSSKDRLQAKSIIEAMIANRQHADLASAVVEAWDHGDHWRDAIHQSIASYDDNLQTSLRAELSKGVTELGSDPVDYELAEEPAKKKRPSRSEITGEPGRSALRAWTAGQVGIVRSAALASRKAQLCERARPETRNLLRSAAPTNRA